MHGPDKACILKPVCVHQIVLWAYNLFGQYKSGELLHIKQQKRWLQLRTFDNDTSSEDIPHVDECRTCDTCVVEDTLHGDFQECGTARFPGVILLHCSWSSVCCPQCNLIIGVNKLDFLVWRMELDS